MRVTFTLDNNNHAQSELRSKMAPHTITVGTPVLVTCPYQTERGVLHAGAKGFVMYVDETTGEVGILMEGIEPALVHWDNMLVIMPYDTEDLLACLEFKRALGAVERRVSTYWRMLAASVVAFLGH
jgi:hypothetical protein